MQKGWGNIIVYPYGAIPWTSKSSWRNMRPLWLRNLLTFWGNRESNAAEYVHFAIDCEIELRLLESGDIKKTTTVFSFLYFLSREAYLFKQYKWPNLEYFRLCLSIGKPYKKWIFARDDDRLIDCHFVASLELHASSKGEMKIWNRVSQTDIMNHHVFVLNQMKIFLHGICMHLFTQYSNMHFETIDYWLHEYEGHETITLQAGDTITLRTSEDWADAGSTEVSWCIWMYSWRMWDSEYNDRLAQVVVSRQRVLIPSEMSITLG